MKIQIFGEIELSEHIKNGGFTYSHCISIRNKKSFMGSLDQEILERFDRILELEFHDIERREWMPPNNEEIPIPEKTDIQKVIDFINLNKRKSTFNGVTIHCWRGISRSAAIALGILYMECKDEELAFKQLMEIRSQARPLNRIIDFWDDVLGSNLKSVLDIHKRKWSEDYNKIAFEYLENEYIEELDPIDEPE